ncbi:MAG: rod shape-determining protein, partial [Deltaproteobacteria bacterium]|nr:rod shape-determining protein [Deltaproteobacteria bacterium]
MLENSRGDAVGIDFGTTNTYVTVCPIGTKNKIPLYLSGRTPAIDTVILYSDKEGHDSDLFPLIGERATFTFGQASVEEIKREGYRYGANFKLDIVEFEPARQCAVDFFKALIRDAAHNGTPLNTSGGRLIVGAPSESGRAYRQALKQIVQEAGLGQAEIVEEPKGALLSDLGGGRLLISDLLEGYLAVDFGGGTCDFALLSGGEVSAGWGSWELGGRLFDDLFYQWFGEQNPGLLESLERERRAFYVWSYLCRKLKEDFSETISANPKASLKAEIGRFGDVRDLTRQGFLERAARFSPSPLFLSYYNKFKLPISKRLSEGNINLIQWFKESLLEGLKNIDKINTVSLSGGSSRWFFVKEICLEVFKSKNIKILHSHNPFGAISEGLAILPAITYEFINIKENIKINKDTFFKDEIFNYIKSFLDRCSIEISKQIVISFFDDNIIPILKKYSEENINIETIETKINEVIDS